MKSIVLIVSRDGESRIETKGFSGSSCQVASQFLEQALGHKQREQLTADFFRQESIESQRAKEQQ